MDDLLESIQSISGKGSAAVCANLVRNLRPMEFKPVARAFCLSFIEWAVRMHSGSKALLLNAASCV